MSKSVVFKRDQGFLSTLPIGVIIGWHRDLNRDKYIPQLPPGWVECNGKPIEVEGSPFYGQNTPNLNGEGRFLRGAATSGARQDDAFQGHHHQTEDSSDDAYYWGGPFQTTTGLGTYDNTRIHGPTSDGVNGTPRTANETRPVNMSVIWIMKVKEVVAAKAIAAVKADTNAPLGAVYVDREGNVGIGTASPQAKLDINGTIQAREIKTTHYSASGTHAVTVPTTDKWADFPDLTITLSLSQPTNLLASYQITMDGRGDHLVTRLVVDGEEQIHTRALGGNTKYWSLSNVWIGPLSAGGHTIKVQFRSDVGTINDPTGNDYHTRALSVLVLGS